MRLLDHPSTGGAETGGAETGGAEKRPWDMLYSDQYYKKFMTEELAKQLMSCWDEIGGEKLVWLFGIILNLLGWSGIEV